jgi:hypothetical protein
VNKVWHCEEILLLWAIAYETGSTALSEEIFGLKMQRALY